ncbi:MAG: GAF domain-containing sensor histidine kinase [Anaerolineae bacterium]|nr:GAF domain-containing sensor histidine kinase [Anaerolineae bacterium]
MVDALDSPEYSNVTSVSLLRLRSVMCVPLISRGQALGAVYLENRADAAVFGQRDLSLMTIFANQAAVLIEAALLRATLEARVQERTAALSTAREDAERNWWEALRANELRTSFLADLTHDLRAPLSVAVGAASMLQDEMFGPLSEEQRDWNGRILQALLHVSALTDQMFTLTSSSPPKAGEARGTSLTFRPAPVDPVAFLNQLYQVGRALPWAKGVAFRLELPSQLPGLPLDGVRIRQVLFNLLSNALKFTRSGQVTLYAQARQDGLLMGVRDTGIGIPTDQLEHIFKRHHQVKGAPETTLPGAGLGLNISQELVALHGGTIWVESTLGQGADFKFLLPWQAASSANLPGAPGA